ncbi:MAG: DUF1565 domain-containing protein, partial [Armatimonadetes bacterium]|nr:DUF1565 domain-containing protein [Armatimonadota bacterium]
MRRHCKRWPLLALLLALPASATTWWVATTGDDKAAGSEAAPFRTISRAAEAAVAGDTVQIRAGVYRETVRPRNSGQPGAPITYRPARGEKVTISGADPITGWQADRDQVYRAPMAGDFYCSALNYAEQVFVDGQMVNLARWPN